MRDFRQLQVWKKAHELTLNIYKTTRSFSRAEVYGLTSQLRRASASIGANLAEGCGRSTVGDLRRFVDIASGSASEVDYHLLLARDLSEMQEPLYVEFDQAINEVKKMLNALGKSLRS
ncbi:four helix bundle protein [Bythopirellula polymerisocia]|uniref:Four helix bundle protein n=1 Tax=Bythopirellula polymerisocia TaxID=2528003 RepID=A0A5C6C8J9_9BACT|nr:four helix bundle protein [Bythopirellula polymerisocia]TWU20880.1 hypothetical protein Pla144_47800 [Bythopirellula polymerisocia]